MPRKILGGKLKYRLALPITIVISLLLAISIISDYHLQKMQDEDALREQAYMLSQQMQAIWDFVSVNQDRINTDADGSYNFKGLHCSIVGTSVGALFTDRTDYVFRYVSDPPRNDKNTPDALESEAIDAFRANADLKEYASFGVLEEEGEEYYRYFVPLKMKSDCVSCHGEPKGEIDITGFPKEGYVKGDLVGVASISIPVELYRDNLAEQTALQALVSAAILAACLFTVYFVSMRYVIRPLGKVETAVSEIGAGNFETRINPDTVHAHDEMKTLSEHVNEMAMELDSLHRNLEDKIAERTEQLADANAMLLKQAEELESANRRLQADDRYKSHYFTMMSHELRTPLTAIRVYVDMVKDPACDREQRRGALEMIQANTISLSKLVNNILDSARLEAGAVKLEPSTVDATDLINELARTLEPLARAKHINLEQSTVGDVPLFLADEGKLLHILENLGSNAIKYSTEGSRVRVRSYYDDASDTIRFDVIDNGSGIPEEEQQAVFEKFRQTESAMSKPVSGSGLGLALAKEYTELHGGTIVVRSKPGEGSTFTVCLPYHKPDFDFE